MSDRFESDVMGDLFEEAEGSSHFEEFDEDSYEEDAGDEDEFLSRVIGGIGQVIGGQSADDQYESMEEQWEGDAGDELDSVDSMEDALVDALEAEDADEFFRRLRGIARRFG
ncbi:MAG TPA: hypothetical protein VN289_23375, partial [Paraburkholderia sp.]|nr:hypothetical protein [Paraburkholderia sp.]